MDNARFLKVYANLPINLRKDIVLVLDNEPITWNVAFVEIDNNTKLGERIFDKLVKLNII
ncbi:MAG: hypothetical protein ABIG10_04180 [bacterium]